MFLLFFDSSDPLCGLAQSLEHGTQFMDFVEVFDISLDLSTIYFANFSGC